MENSYIAYAIIAIGVFTAYMAAVQLFKRNRMRERLQAVDVLAAEEEAAAPPVFASFCERALRRIGARLTNRRDIEIVLAQAGVTSSYGVVYYLFFKVIVQPVLLALGAFLFLRTLLFVTGLSASMKLFHTLLSLLLIVAGLHGTKLFISNSKQRRQDMLRQSFPEALDLLLVCIESGLGLDAALAKTCAELGHAHPVITSELQRTRTELAVMNDRVQALQNLADRTDIIPFRSLVAALIQTEKFGTSLVDTLRVLSEDMRIMRLLYAENRAARIPVLITIPLIFCILPAFIMIILGPAYVKVQAQGGIFGEKSTDKKALPTRNP